MAKGVIPLVSKQAGLTLSSKAELPGCQLGKPFYSTDPEPSAANDRLSISPYFVQHASLTRDAMNTESYLCQFCCHFSQQNSTVGGKKRHSHGGGKCHHQIYLMSKKFRCIKRLVAQSCYQLAAGSPEAHMKKICWVSVQFLVNKCQCHRIHHKCH